MKTIQVYDPPVCCSTGLCRTGIDPALVSFAAMLTQLSQAARKLNIVTCAKSWRNNPPAQRGCRGSLKNLSAPMLWPG